MNDVDEILLVDESRSLIWNYVSRVDKELEFCSDFRAVLADSLIPSSYREVVSLVSRASSCSRVALLLDDEESFVAFMLVVDDDYTPFLLEGLGDVVLPVPSVFKVFVNSEVAHSGSSSGVVGSGEDSVFEEFVNGVVIPDLNDDFDSWERFSYEGA